MRWTEERLAEFQKRHGLAPDPEPVKGKAPKFGNTKVKTPEGTFDSKHEYQRWCELKMMQRAGQVADLRRQVTFILAPAVVLDGKKKPPLRFTADFVYLQCGVQVVEDFKSPITAEERAFRIRVHLMKSVHNIEVKIVMKK